MAITCEKSNVSNLIQAPFAKNLQSVFLYSSAVFGIALAHGEADRAFGDLPRGREGDLGVPLPVGFPLVVPSENLNLSVNLQLPVDAKVRHASTATARAAGLPGIEEGGGGELLTTFVRIRARGVIFVAAFGAAALALSSPKSSRGRHE